MDEGFDTVDGDDGDVVLIFVEQLRIRFNIDFFERESITTAGILDHCFSLVAEVASGLGINDYLQSSAP